MDPIPLRAVARYIYAHDAPLDPFTLAQYLERAGQPLWHDLTACQDDFNAVVARCLAIAAATITAPHDNWHQEESAVRMAVRTALQSLLVALHSGRINGRQATTDREQCRCLLGHLGEALAVPWTALREQEARPRLIEQLLWPVCPHETPSTNPILALVVFWTQCALA